MANPTYSIVVPVYNEAESLPELAHRLDNLLHRLDGPGEVVLVDDGSVDSSWDIISRLTDRDERFRAIRLSRNFGHQLAITAGLEVAAGDAVVVMDADMQDPPEVVLEMARQWRAGYDIVYGIRESRSGESTFKRLTAHLFYRLFNRIARVDAPPDVGDFRLVDRSALQAFKAMRERNRYVRGMFSWIGFRQTGVTYVRAERHAGTTKYPLRKMLRLAADGVIAFSDAPLRFVLHLGFAVSAISFAFGVAAIVSRLVGLYHVSGLASLVVFTAFLGGIQLIVLGVIGAYVGRMHDEVKNRPLYIVRETRNLHLRLPCTFPDDSTTLQER